MSTENVLENVKQALAEHGESLKTFQHDIKQEQAGVKSELQNALQVIAKLESNAGAVPSMPYSTRPDVAKSLVEEPTFKDFAEGRADSTRRVLIEKGIKTVTSVSGSPEDPQTGIPVFGQRVPGLFGPGQRQQTLTDVLPSIPAISDTVQFIRLTSAFDFAADYQEGEGTAKAEGSLPSELITANIATIAWHITASKQVMGDMAQLQQSITSLLVYGVRAKLEDELINGDGGNFHISGLMHEATGMATDATTPADRIGETISLMASDGLNPSLIVLSPYDWFNIQKSKDTQERYLMGSPAQPVAPSLWNVDVVTTPALTDGSALVLDTKQVAVLDREQTSLVMSRDHSDNFTKNLVTLLAETRVGLAVYNKEAVRHVLLDEADSGV